MLIIKPTGLLNPSPNIPLVVSAAELRAGAVGHTLDPEAHRQADEVVRTLAGGPLPARRDQTQVTARQRVGRAGVLA